MPDPYGGFLDGLSVMALDIVQVLPFNCASTESFGHFEGLVMVTLFPIAVLLLGAAGLLVAFKLFESKMEKRHKLTLFLQALMLMLPAISRHIFQSFRCEPYDLGDSKFFLLASDHEIDCTDGHADRYNMIVCYALFMVLIYPLGTPLAFFLLLAKFRHRLDPKGVAEAQVIAKRSQQEEEARTKGWALTEDTGKFDKALSKAATKDLFEKEPITCFALPYKPRFWYFEVYVMFRR